MKKIFINSKIKIALLMVLLFLGTFKSFSAGFPLYESDPTLILIDAEFRDFRYDPTVTATAPKGAITFEVWFKAGRHYNSTNWADMNYRLTVMLEPGVILNAATGAGNVMTSIANPAITNLDAADFRAQSYAMAEHAAPAGWTAQPVSLLLFRKNTGPDLGDSYQLMTTVTMPLDASSTKTPSDAMYLIPHTGLSGIGAWWKSFDILGSFGITLQNANDDGKLFLGGGTPTCPPTATWTGATSDDWNTAGNWNVNAVPGACTKVTIPAGVSRYPVLTGTKASNVCDEIYFEFGGEVAHTYLLTYNTAKVDMTIKDNRWYMLAAPLRNMYSGDYFIDDIAVGRLNPSVYMMQYQSNNPETGAAHMRGDWSYPFNTLHVDLSVAKGFAVWVDEGTMPSGDWTFAFPKDSTDYRYYNTDGTSKEEWVTDPVNPDKLGSGSPLSRGNKSRFTYESASDLNATTGAFSVSITDNDQSYPNLIVGNPFMSHLDLKKFYEANKTEITNSFYLWSEDDSFISYATYNEWYVLAGKNPLGVAGASHTVAPMQSFFVVKQNPGFAMAPLKFTPDMEVTLPGDVLKNAETDELEKNVLKLDLYRDGTFQSGIAVRYDKDASNGYEDMDSWTLFPDETQIEIPSSILYSLINGKAATINSLNDLGPYVELGISSLKKSNQMKLVCRGDENFDGNCEIYLIDRLDGSRVNLRTNPEYPFANTTGNITDRFALHITGNVSGLNDASLKDIEIYSENGEIYVSGEKLQKVEVFNLQGQIIAQRDNINNTSVTMPTAQGQTFVVVKAYSATGVKTAKVKMN